MSKSISAAQARNNFADVIGRAHFGDETFVVERLGKPVAVIIGYSHYQKLLKAQQRRERELTETATAPHADQARLL